VTDDRPHTYEDGIREGELHAIRELLCKHEQKHERIDQRLLLLERLMWMLFGAIALIQFMPFLNKMFAVAS